MKKRYIKLTEEECRALSKLRRAGTTARQRDRCHALLLSNKGYDTNELCDIFDINMPALLSWFNRWEADGIDGLSDKPRSGRRRKLTGSDEKK